MRLNLPGLWAEKRRGGSTVYRVRVKGDKRRKILLHVTPDHPAFMEHYHAARAGIETPAPEDAAAHVVPRSVAWLTLKFEDWMEGRVRAGQMHRGTLHQRRAFFAALRAVYGEKDMRMPRGKLVEYRDTLADTPGAANNMVKAVRACYSWAEERGIVTANPAKGIKPLDTGTRGAVPWSVDDLAQYRETHPKGTTAHLALSLFMFTACRISDAIRLGRDNERTIDGIRHLDWQPAKKGSARVVIPILPPLADALAARTVIGPTYLLTEHGRPFASSAAFGNRFRAWCVQAGLEDRSSHGIRKAAGELLALQGASQYEITAVHGHSTAKTSEVYTKGYNRLSAARTAMSRLEGMEW